MPTLVTCYGILLSHNLADEAAMQVFADRLQDPGFAPFFDV